MRISQVETDLLNFADRIRKVQGAAIGLGRKVSCIEGGVLILQEDIEAPAHAICGEVRIEVADVQTLLECTLVDADTNGASCAQKVLRLQCRADEEVSTAARTNAEGNITEVLLFHGELDIHLICGTWHFNRLHFHRGEIPETFESDLRQFDVLTGRGSRFELTH